MQEIYAARPPAIIVADGCEINPGVRQGCEASGTPLLTTPMSSAFVIDTCAPSCRASWPKPARCTACFMDVLGMGVLITGDSGVGKSELGLELISRGHGLVADDVVDVSRIGSDTLEGRCPKLLKDFLEVRGLGLLNIRTVFGETACRRKMRLKLIVHLQKPTPGRAGRRAPAAGCADRNHPRRAGTPRHLPVAAGRNLAVLLEAAVRATVLKLRGIDSMQEFLDRQEAALRPTAARQPVN
jgi:HPr kinase/phosphorylase